MEASFLGSEEIAHGGVPEYVPHVGADIIHNLVDKFEHEEEKEFPHVEVPHIAEGTFQTVKTTFLANANKPDDATHAVHIDTEGHVIASPEEFEQHHYHHAVHPVTETPAVVEPTEE